MARAKFGILPMYIKLYDDLDDGTWRKRIDEFPRTIAAELSRRGLEVVTAPVCRIRAEFAAAMKRLEAEGVHAIVTLHLAYSPSLESSDVLAATRLPIIVLDTTPTYSFSPTQDPGELMYNHGIHGVQDMCNLLIRNGKPFLIEAGHWQKSDVLDRVAALADPARMAAAMSRGRVGMVGSAFKGMGDFFVPPERLRSTLGAKVKSMSADALATLLAAVKQKEVEAEMAEDRARFAAEEAAADAPARSVKLGLALRRWIEKERLSALTFSFLDMKKKSGYLTAPFLEMSKAMARGIGYAGEGDTLTALLVSALMAAIPETSFTEMFCPDWENGMLFLSHMGEVNWRLLDGAPRLREMAYTFSATDNPALVVGRLRPGEVVLTNLAPMPGDSYRLIVAPATMQPAGDTDRHRDAVRGWFTPALPVAEFLTEYSRKGGTHHLSVSYTGDTRPIETFGRMMGWDVVVIR